MKTLVSVAVLLVGTLAAGAAHAGNPLPKRSESEVRAEKWFRAGLEQSRAGDQQAALASFSAAYADVPSVDILWNLASTERRVGRTIAALAHLRAYITHPSARADRRPMAEQWIEELSAQVAQVRIVSSAETSIDGVPRSGADLLPGIHTVSARCEDRTKNLAIDVAAGDQKEIAIACEQPAVVAAPPVLAAMPMQMVTVTKPISNARTWTVLGLSIGAAASVAGGVFFASQAASAQGSADGAKVALGGNGFSCKSSGSVCADYDDARSRATRDTGISTGLFVLSGLSAGAAVATYLLWPKETETKLVPVVTPSAAAMSLSGRF